MKKIILSIVLISSIAGPSFAQNNMEAMRFLTINALVQYGQRLYDRGDFNGACAVFNHVLSYDGHQAQALQYLKDMGHSPVVPVKNILVARKLYVNTVNLSDANTLKRAIEAKKRVIEKLRAQIRQMRETLASQI